MQIKTVTYPAKMAITVLFMFAISAPMQAIGADCGFQRSDVPRPPVLFGGNTASDIDRPFPVQKLFLTERRLEELHTRIKLDPEIYNSLKSRVNRYFDSVPYNTAEFSVANLLLFILDNDERYLAKAREYYDLTYRTVPGVGWSGYDSRNGFRTGAIWAALYYSWARDYLPAGEADAIKQNMQVWGAYWLDHIDYSNNFDGFRWSDSDETTSLAENLTILGYVLQDEPIGAQLLNAGDCLLQRFVIDEFLMNTMAGGLWGEGSYYSPSTVGHLARLMLFNREHRNINLNENYIGGLIKGIVYGTLPRFRGLLPYGDIQAATDYTDLSDERYYNGMLLLSAALRSDRRVEYDIGYDWLSNVKNMFGAPDSSGYTHIWRLLFEDRDYQGASPKDLRLPLMFFASGLDHVSVRSEWGDDASLFYIGADRRDVDHQQSDALAFGIARKGKWLSKEASGYGGIAGTSSAHNTLLIENATEDGSSNPTGRPKGDGDILRKYDSADFTYIAADATDVYNMSGYHATDYAVLVSRQVAIIKPDIFVLYDSIITDPTQTRDLQQYKSLAAGPHTRWVKYIQHFESRPIINGESYVSETEGQQIHVGTVLPLAEDRLARVVDESVAWSDALESQVPIGQRKWHVEVKYETPRVESEFMHVIATGDIGSSITPDRTEVMTRQNGRIGADSDNAAGVALQFNGDWFVLIFPSNPKISLRTIEYDLSFIGSGNVIQHLVLGVDPAERYAEIANGSNYVWSVTDQSNAISATDGVISVTRQR